jgi:parallel beta-helix repeat protein
MNHIIRKKNTIRTMIAIMLALALAVSVSGLHLGTFSSYATSTCVSAGSTGLTAYVVATSGQTLKGQIINAAGCDVGIYVAPGSSGVTITGNTITGANDHGILVQDSKNVAIMGNTVSGNGVAPHSSVQENKAIELVGTSDSIVKNNVVSYNTADGGIGVADDGSINPGAPNSGSPNPATGNMITGNLIEYNLYGCGIVVAAYNSNGGVYLNTVTGNTVLGASFATIGTYGPAVGGIVVAADVPNAKVLGNVVQNNQIQGSLIPGVVVHSNAPGDLVSGTVVIHNTISSSGDETANSNEPPAPNGIMIVAETSSGMPNPPRIIGTVVNSNTVTDDYYGIWTCSASLTVVHNLMGNSVVPKASC